MNLWESVELSGNFPAPCFGPTAVMISKTKVLLYGGATGDKGKYTMTGDTYLFNIFRNEWAKIERYLSH